MSKHSKLLSLYAPALVVLMWALLTALSIDLTMVLRVTFAVALFLHTRAELALHNERRRRGR